MIKKWYHGTCDRCQKKILGKQQQAFESETEAYEAMKKAGWFFMWVPNRREMHFCPKCTEQYLPAELARS